MKMEIKNWTLGNHQSPCHLIEIIHFVIHLCDFYVAIIIVKGELFRPELFSKHLRYLVASSYKRACEFLDEHARSELSNQLKLEQQQVTPLEHSHQLAT